MVLIVLALLVLALAGAVYLLVDGVQNRVNANAAPPPPRTAELTAAIAFDPEGGDGEHDGEVSLATDGDPGTHWSTETYQDFVKSGVGIVLEAEPAAALDELKVTTDGSDFPAKIRASNDQGGPFVDVSGVQTVRGETTFDLDTDDRAFRYYLVWLRLPDGGVAHVNEVR